MTEFVDAAVGFPTVLCTSPLLVVIGFWLLVLLGAAESDGFDTDVDTDERAVRSPNGEDVLFAFHARATGRTFLLSYK
jgi:hypothetical protein